MSDTSAEATGHGSEFEAAGVRLIVLNLPEDEGEGLGFRLTRTLWDPYPWVRDVIAGSRADSAGLRMGDCLLQADGKDLLGLPVGQVAGLIRGDGAGRGVSLLVWNCGVDPKDDPELLWSCGGGARGERSRRALSGVVKALACCVCASTATRALNCARSHIYCEACWSRLERCALCREPLPAKDSPYARNLVAEQVFEAIATEYDIKDALKKPRETLSAYNTPNRSPNVSPSVTRRGHYQLSLMNRKKAVHFNELGQSYGSDPNIHRSVELQRQLPKTTIGGGSEAGNTAGCQFQTQITQIKLEHGSDPNIHRSVDLQRQPPKTTISGSFPSGNTASAGCQCRAQIPQIKVEDADACAPCAATLQHKLVARLRHACSMADLQNAALQSCQLSRSLNSLGCCPINQTSSLENLKNGSNSTCGEYAPVPLGGGLLWETPVFLLPAPPIYVLACDHSANQ